VKIPQCEIRVSTLTGLYYISCGAVRKTTEYKTFRGAVKAATRQGFEVTNASVDPMIEFKANETKTKIVTNLQSDKLVRIGVNTPLCCDPSSETYWSS
jgi:hypothetical protein